MDKILYQVAIETIKEENQPKVLKAFLDMQLFVIADANFEEPLKPSDAPLDLPFTETAFEIQGEDTLSNIIFGVIEKGFNDYTFYQYKMEDDKVHFNVNWVNNDQPNNQKNIDNYNEAKEVIRVFCNKLNSFKSMEIQLPSVMVKTFKPNSNKTKNTPLKLGTVIYIAESIKHKKSIEKQTGKKNWNVSFRSRGHWRKVNNIGKNREGRYVIKGFTWVKESKLKGNGPILNQVRIIS